VFEICFSMHETPSISATFTIFDRVIVGSRWGHGHHFTTADFCSSAFS